MNDLKSLSFPFIIIHFLKSSFNLADTPKHVFTQAHSHSIHRLQSSLLSKSCFWFEIAHQEHRGSAEPMPQVCVSHSPLESWVNAHTKPHDRQHPGAWQAMVNNVPVQGVGTDRDFVLSTKFMMAVYVRETKTKSEQCKVPARDQHTHKAEK